jgi:mycothiol synthase
MPALYTWRAATAADLPALHALKTAVFQADGEPSVPPLADLQRQFDDLWCPPAFNTRLAVTRLGAVLAYGRVSVPPAPASAARAYLAAEVHPAHRAEGLEDALLAWLVARGRACLNDLAAAGFTGPRQLCAWASNHLTGRVAALRRHGFQPNFSVVRLRRSLRQPLPELPLPAGLTLTAYAPEWDEKLRVFQNEIFAEDPAQDQISRADWQTYYIENSAARLDLTFLIHAGPQVVAYSINRVFAAENTRPGQTTGWIHTLGTHPDWRRRGLASHLLAVSLAAFRAAGLDHATLEAYAGGPLSARGLYERLGFVAFQTSTEFAQDLV